MFPRGTVSRTHAKQRKQSAFCGELSVAHICLDEVNTPELTGTSASGEGRGVRERWEQSLHCAPLGNFRTFCCFKHSTNLLQAPPNFTHRILWNP